MLFLLAIAATMVATSDVLNTSCMDQKPLYYFAYGSNLWSERIKASVKNPVFFEVGHLKNYELEFTLQSNRWGGAAANIIPKNGSELYGVIWQIDQEDLENLDRQEGVKSQIYDRKDVTVSVSDGSLLKVITYILFDTTRENSVQKLGPDNLKPSVPYKNVILRGAKQNNLPHHYLQWLEKIPDNGFTGPVNVPNLPPDLFIVD